MIIMNNGYNENVIQNMPIVGIIHLADVFWKLMDLYVQYHCRGPMACWATASMSSGIVGMKAPCTKTVTQTTLYITVTFTSHFLEQ